MGATSGRAAGHASKLRIIGGRWRGRRLSVPATTNPGVRPTPARLRETLFNWLHYHLEGKRCLDLFAGSGALGFEALSRGASHVTFVESDARLCAELKMMQKRLAVLEATSVECASAETFLKCYVAGSDSARASANTFDIVFVDPPFASGLCDTTLDLLAHTPKLLSDDALIYVECPKKEKRAVPNGWRIWRQTDCASVSGAVLTAGERII